MADTEESIVHCTREERRKAACPRCGFLRKVRVSHVQKVKIVYQLSTRPGRMVPDREEISREDYGPPEAEHIPICTACDYARRAGVHEDAARKYRTMAAKILKKRKELLLKRPVEVSDVPASDGAEG